MRRGPSGRVSWRNDSPRQFRPRSGNPNFRPRNLLPTPYLDAPRFPGPSPGFRGPRPGLNHSSGNQSNAIFNRIINDRNPWNKHHQGPPDHRDRRGNYYDNPSSQHDPYNSLRDVDQRIPPLISHPHNQDNNRPYVQPWACRADDRHDRGDRFQSSGSNRPFSRYYDDEPQMGSRGLPVDSVGHRPPASDYYDSVPRAAIDESNSFSRSVDDTVDIVRRKLMSRNDPQTHQARSQSEFDHDAGPMTPRPSSESDHYQHVNAEHHSAKKKKQRRTMKQNCDTIKNKIVHQFFKMDKGKIHKLMDNPNSSSKFEYAINSLITESQNSFNRYKRSVAEKSLSGSITRDIQYEDTDTIYEDTFMRQMQCILDPQDTVFLEDIKPIVMAELNKVLQLDGHMELPYEQPIREAYRRPSGPYDREDYITVDREDYITVDKDYENEQPFDREPYRHFPNERDEPDRCDTQNENMKVESQETRVYDNNPLYKRRPARKRIDVGESSFDVNKLSSDVDKPANRRVQERCSTPVSFFEATVQSLSDEEDQFAELDKQYHVAVGLNFIGPDDFPRPTTPTNDYQDPVTNYQNEISPKIKTEPEVDKDSMMNSDNEIKILNSDIEAAANDLHLDTQTVFNKNSKESDKSNKKYSKEKFSVMKESAETEVKDHMPSLKPDLEPMEKSSTYHPSRKRPADPPHRKEKRKKSESPQETNNQILNKNIIINLNNDCKKSAEKCESKSKSVVNLYFSKSKTDKDSNDIKKDKISVDTSYSDKYVKRKDSTENKKSSNEAKNRHNSTSSNHSVQSPTDNTNATPVKSDVNSKLKTIDIFSEISNRRPSVHQAHRNTAVTSTPIKTEEKVKTIPLKVLSKQVTRRHVGSQTIFKPVTKGTQTIGKRLVNSTTQTNSMSMHTPSQKSTDPFERMKEIDLEIQELVQEKFKLYNSLESKESSNSMQNLGMTVLNMVPDPETNKDSEEISIAEDAIIEDFTNIPAEELAQIAMETVDAENILKSSQSERDSKSESKLKQYQSAKSKKPIKTRDNLKTPNISLLEQIITDDRPLEDIISLDDLEESPHKPSSKKKNNSKKSSSKKSKKNKKHDTPKVTIDPKYNIKECSVVLNRINEKKCEELMNKQGIVMKPKRVEKDQKKSSKTKTEEAFSNKTSTEVKSIDKKNTTANDESTEVEGIPKVDDVLPELSDSIIASISFPDDMWDVSEDIIIGADDEKKDTSDPIPMSEEVVLDNSQSEDEGVEHPQTSSECKLYDFSSKEDMGNDILAVTGNADAVLAIELIENNFLAACLDGNVYHFNGEGQLLATLRGSNLAVTCLTIVNEKHGTTVYTGSLDSRIRYYDLETGLERGPECNVLSPIQTMDRAWDTVFVGTRTGFVLQFECKNNMLIPISSVKFSDQSILALRALKEGPRKVLLVASRSESVTIKDALTGLLLRTLDGPKMTVYTLLFEDGKVYCGTSSNQIQVFDYSSGSHIGEHEGGKGAVCLRAAGGLLFAGCYDGCVYVFKTSEPRPFAQLRGPNVMLLSLAVHGTRIIAGYKDRSLFVWKIPVGILKEMVL